MSVLVHFVSGDQQRFDDDYEAVVSQLEGGTTLLRLKIAGGETAVLSQAVAYVEPVSDGTPIFDT